MYGRMYCHTPVSKGGGKFLCDSTQTWRSPGWHRVIPGVTCVDPEGGAAWHPRAFPWALSKTKATADIRDLAPVQRAVEQGDRGLVGSRPTFPERPKNRLQGRDRKSVV